MAIDTNLLPPRYKGPHRIGRGGMGDIFRATDDTLGRAVAVKVLAERYAEDDSIRERFTREALAAARLSGEPNIVTIFDVGEWNERPFIVMEYLGGGSLDSVLRREGAQPPERALEWLEQAARALDAAHAQGVVHRDVKPGNLLLDRNGNVHVADFGIASAGGLDSLTVTGTVLGTAGYLSPEQARGERATPASDRYGLAVVAFELLTGKRPFEGDSPTAEAAAHVHAEVPSVCERGDLPCELDPVFDRALAKQPERRFGTAAEFVAALRQSLADAAGATRELPVAAAVPPTAPTRPVRRTEQERPVAAPPAPPRRQAPAARSSRTVWPLLLGLLVLAAIGGAILAVVLTRGDGGGQPAAAPQPSVVTKVRTVTRQGQATTVQQTVTTTPPASTSAPPPSAPPSSASGHTLNDRGFSRMRAGDYNGALPLLQQAVQKLQGVGPGDPYEGFANYNLGYTLLKVGRCSEAAPYLARAQRLEPQRPEPGQALEQAKRC